MFNKYAKAGMLVIFLFAFLIVPVAAQHQYYVAMNGNDANPGTMNAPWATIGHAADSVTAGDSVYIREGVYNEHVHIQTGGNAGAYVTFCGYPGETPVIDGSGVAESENGIIVDGSYVRLTGLEIRNWNENGIWVEHAGYLAISDCKVHNVAYGIGLADGTHDFVLNRVEMYNFDYYGFDASPSGGADCYNGVLNDCIAHDWRNPGLGHETDGFAFSHEGSQHGFTLNRCRAYNVGDGFVFGGRDITASYCTAENSEVGFKMWGDDITLDNCLSSGNELSNIELDWNGVAGTTTLRNCQMTDSGTYNIWIENSRDSLHMYYCVLAGGDTLGLAFEMRDIGNYEGDYNIFHNDDPDRAIVVGYEDEFSLDGIRAGDWIAYSGQDSNSVAADSLEEALSDLELPGGPGDGGTITPAGERDWTEYNRQDSTRVVAGLIEDLLSGRNTYDPDFPGTTIDIESLFSQHNRERDDTVAESIQDITGNRYIPGPDQMGSYPDIESLFSQHNRERDDIVAESIQDITGNRYIPGPGQTGDIGELAASHDRNRHSILSYLLNGV